MSDAVKPPMIFQFGIRGIEILKKSYNPPRDGSNNVGHINFDIKLQSKIKREEKLIYIIVAITIKNENSSYVFGELEVNCIYAIINFDELIKFDDKNQPDINKILLDTLIILSISTTRGVMFSEFQGTILQSSVLPLVDPKKVIVQTDMD